MIQIQLAYLSRATPVGILSAASVFCGYVTIKVITMPSETAHVVLLLIVSASIALMLTRPREIPEVWWISGGAILSILLRLVPLPQAGRAVAKGSYVYLFLIGMMLLSELAREQGVFNWMASVAVRGANGSCSRLFLLVYGTERS